MTKKRKVHAPEFKARVSLAAIKGMSTSSELASQFKIHPTQISSWKKQAVEGLVDTFRNGPKQLVQDPEELTAPLYQEIGRLKMQLDYLKKNTGHFSDE
ncbi:hypothetical protein AB833_01415 [Chromatiales bacterium (ex Bugula neritina AB1)]|nr:hypothetical protein AB833_15415 [Chromatiales bacterium (ex Bugula neritina AB1)]OED40212.1 hypothetical protein AB833_12340 [Chromatiales bacterium (ex Bugula neritina AB1)]OED41551.1 hypothetical protein AB833_09270 [Chromatiales bacterium (ex Bugula neritina AB1)]OED42633.1 hypothetical protein AB833_05835 [Chromatiales bacterium (ex Bugula neritina AB1)]OED44274.1 hypothetical protein AB833_01840 [Chromatiales bacterium (ex Bugula neritina AB1)]